ncbi:MAG: family 78 glycoside hydrolase catalytic domain [Clostridia bacterium]|nr:family 78 glycoside hydrolase catalytic domain [Clostridia bacterium]
MKVFEKAKWIWVDENVAPDTYGEFYDEFIWQGEKTLCRISVDGDYTLFVNGKFVESNQYGDFEWYKSYDSVDITPYLQAGKNGIAILVWHFGTNSQRYLKAAAGLIYEVEEKGLVRAQSGENTLSRYSKAYQNGLQKLITSQLGYSYLYNATKEDGWIKGELQGFTPSAFVDKNCTFISRPVQKAKLLAPKEAKIIKEKGKTYYLLDLGEEVVGLLSFTLSSATEQKITVSYGEHIRFGGRVSRFVDARDFSVEYITKAGENEYTNYMLRFACRYLQIESENAIDLRKISIIPQVYPVAIKPFTAQNKQDEEIYKLCLNSLRLCMMEHYVDCPWREQCLYAFDSRNQILCGYYAFEGGNFEYARANLLLMSQDRYPNGLMSICYPCGNDLTIPSFSLYYTLSVKEYMEHSGDISIAKEVYPRIRRYMDAILARRKDGLIYRFEGETNWNFYDWSEHSEGALHGLSEVIPDAQLNILTVMALRSLKRICALADLEYPYGDIDTELAQNVTNAFYNEEKQLFSVTKGGEEYVEIVNALAVAFDIVTGKRAQSICEKLANGDLIPCSLSMQCFKYDALLKTDEEKYSALILAEIRKQYQLMLDSGSSAAWETMDGAEAFDNAGSLCHGWSATPVYYLKKLNAIQ